MNLVQDLHADWDAAAFQEWCQFDRTPGDTVTDVNDVEHLAFCALLSGAESANTLPPVSRELRASLLKLPRDSHTKRAAVVVNKKWNGAVGKELFVHCKLVIITLCIGLTIFKIVSTHLPSGDALMDRGSENILSILAQWMQERPNEHWLIGMDGNGSLGELSFETNQRTHLLTGRRFPPEAEFGTWDERDFGELCSPAGSKLLSVWCFHSLVVALCRIATSSLVAPQLRNT